MSLVFRGVHFPPLADFSATAPRGAIIGLVGENGAGKLGVLRLAAGLDAPVSGAVEAVGSRRYIAPDDALNLAPVDILALPQALSNYDALVRVRARLGLERLRREGAIVLAISHEEDWLRSIADEVWWIHEGRLAAQGDPREVLGRYGEHIASRLRGWGEKVTAQLSPSMRRGDGRAKLVKLETIGENGMPTMVWRSGEQATIGVTVQFEQAVADPVVGIMIRSRVGFEVYGTNTELEGVRLGPVNAGAALRVTFTFRCDLCPQEYTLTAASHDPNGVWHDWVEDALAFSVADARYTAGVANLRARVLVEAL
jgi:ABC-type multidrug transport system ATPase subunit